MVTHEIEMTIKLDDKSLEYYSFLLGAAKDDKRKEMPSVIFKMGLVEAVKHLEEMVTASDDIQVKPIK